MKLTVSEIFGPTIQGEGPSVGRAATFLRLGGCNLACSWCDTPYTWDAKRFDLRKELRQLDVADVLKELLWHRGEGAAAVRHLVITGGEPMLQQPGISALLADVAMLFDVVEIETAGTVPVSVGFLDPPSSLNIRFVVSPKLVTSNNPASKRLNGAALRSFPHERTSWKFVITTEGDLDEVERMLRLASRPPNRSVFVMPEGVEATPILAATQRLAPLAIARGWSVSTRLHVLLWGNRRGV